MRLGKRFSERPRTKAEITDFAEALADMLCAYLELLDAKPKAER